MIADPRLILRDDELDLGLELVLLAESALWVEVDQALAPEGAGLGRSHWRAAFLIRRRPGLGVLDLAALSGLSKQSASKTLGELERAGLAARARGDLDGRRKGAVLTPAGEAFEARVSERLRARIASAYRLAGAEAVLGARKVLSGLAGPKLTGRREG
ncbi:MAG TPA: MarR family transcriptional regulator [Caulobacteraceae bacterium]|nr:MarR family transcriptional regulator [Caulobacteraceae bacterium]